MEQKEIIIVEERKDFTEATGRKCVYVTIRGINWWRGINPGKQSKLVLQLLSMFREEQAAQSDCMQPKCKTDRITKY